MDLVLYTLRSVAYAIAEPSHLLIMVLLAVVFYKKNKNISVIQKITLGESLNSPLELTLSQLVIGIIAGAIGSIICNFIGIAFIDNIAIQILFIISLIAPFTRNRFLEFSYIGAILGLLGIISKVFSLYLNLDIYFKINIVNLMSFIGIFYFIKGILILIDGDRGVLPVFTTRGKSIVGGFAFNRCWPLTMPLFFIMPSLIGIPDDIGNFYNPNWWPIINKEYILPLIATLSIIAMPLYGIASYRTITFIQNKKRKLMFSGIETILYGISVVLISQIGKIGFIGECIVVIYVPLVYEVIIRINKLVEKKGNAIFVSDNEGIGILEVLITSQAYKVGIRSGDKILQINNKDIKSEVEIFKLIKESAFDINIKVKKLSGDIKYYSIKKSNNRSIGLLLVPKTIKKEDILGIDTEM